jgi:hypothetical protein
MLWTNIKLNVNMGCKILEKTAQGWKEVKDKEPMLYR